MNTPEPTQPPVRLRSLDALRGFDMFWILGAGSLVKALEKMSDNSFTRLLSTQLTHVTWEGVRFYDFIFPLFLFIVGVSLVFSLDRTLAKEGREAAVMHIVRRSVLLFLFGVLYTGGLSHKWPEVSLGGVLHRIAACYFFAGLFYVWCASQLKALAAIAVALLVGYWALLTYVRFPDLPLEKASVEKVAKRIKSDDPGDIAAGVPGRVRGLYEEGRNLANYYDFRFLPGKKMSTYYINEGLLSTLPAIAICLFGIFAGRLLKSDATDRRKLAWLVAAGAASILLGWLWSFQFPLIKRIWTSSFILVASGCSAMMLGLFYYIVEVRKWDRWCEPFVWIGMNPITLYLSTKVISYSQVAELFVGGNVKAFFDARAQGLGGMVVALTSLGLVFLLARFLHRRKIFLRV
ncbi:MAG: heparan-alpha-glucosaminide N-acetyltransferase domain-containing protein [Chthoniobacteraceae bacterium]